MYFLDSWMNFVYIIVLVCYWFYSITILLSFYAIIIYYYSVITLLYTCTRTTTGVRPGCGDLPCSIRRMNARADQKNNAHQPVIRHHSNWSAIIRHCLTTDCNRHLKLSSRSFSPALLLLHLFNSLSHHLTFYTAWILLGLYTFKSQCCLSSVFGVFPRSLPLSPSPVLWALTPPSKLPALTTSLTYVHIFYLPVYDFH